MSKFICTGAIPRPVIFCYLCHADPDQLLRLADGPLSDVGAIKFSKVLHDIRISGVWKRTGPKRLAETERVIAARIAGRDDPINALDIGASDGSTTLDLLSALRRQNDCSINMYLADLHLWLVRFGSGSLVEYRATDGQPVMVRLGRFGLRLPRSEHGWDVLSNLLAKWYLGKENLRAGLPQTARIPLINPQALNEPAIIPKEMDILASNPDLIGKLDVVRASNILNREYFNDKQVLAAAKNLHSYLHDDGILVVSRNVGTPDNEVEHGSVWERSHNGFVRVEDFGNGSEVAEIIDNLNLSSVAD